MDAKQQIKILKNSRHFQWAWYTSRYHDAGLLRMSAAEHYFRYGVVLGRNPGPDFDTRFYLSNYPDVRNSGLNPLVHYITHGCRDGRATTAGRQAGWNGAPLVTTEAGFEGPGSPESVRAKRTRMLNLGFLEKGMAELEHMVDHAATATERQRAAWELANFHANQMTRESAEASLRFLDRAVSEASFGDMELDRVSILRAEALSLLGRDLEASAVLSARLALSDAQDLCYARSQYAADENERLFWINRAFARYNVAPIHFEPGEGLLYDRLNCGYVPALVGVGRQPKVTIIIPAYGAEHTIHTTLKSLANQTWKNFEVIVVDDCSPDGTAAAVEAFVQTDARFRLIRLEKNGGPYIARNVALSQATGEFVTINDADDWSHPQKIEVQALHLMSDPQTIANMSMQARVTEDMGFYRRGNEGFYTQLNMSSLMFRRQKVLEKAGYWDSVRFAGDSEFRQRLNLHFGRNSVVTLFTAPLSFQRQTEGSLTGSVSFGYHGYKMGARRFYENAHKAYHTKARTTAYVGFPLTARPFLAPKSMLPTRDDRVRHYDVIIASDFRFPGGTTSSNVEEMKAQAAMGLRTGIVELNRYDIDVHRDLNAKVSDMLARGDVELLVHGEKATCDLLIIRYVGVLQEWQRYLPEIEAGAVRVIINQPPKRDYGPGSDYIYDLQRCSAHLKRYFGEGAVWHPIGPLVRQALVQYHSHELDGINLSPDDWPNIINTAEWRRPIAPPASERIRIGRHSRDGYVKWPDTASDIRKIYPDSDKYQISILGGADVPKQMLGGTLPDNWTVKGFGAVEPRDFLADLDVFVYYTHPHWVESFGRVIFEAMAAGLPVFLPPEYEPTFQEAAIYATPDEVEQKVADLTGDPAAYTAQVERALQYVEHNYGYSVHARRIDAASGKTKATTGLAANVWGKSPNYIPANASQFTSVQARVIEGELRGQPANEAAGSSLKALHARLLADAGAAMMRGPFSVVDKTTLPPSKDPHDYWHPAPYWWPNPNTRDGLPYIRKDGERVPGTEMYDPESEKYDRTRLQRLFDDTWILTLASRVSGDKSFAQKAADHMQHFFLSPATRMNPHLRFAQVRMGHAKNQGSPTGIIEFKDFYFYLDAMRMLEQDKILTLEQVVGFRAWLREYLRWLLRSPQGKSESLAGNNHGTYYDVQVAAIAAYLGERLLLLQTLQRAHIRIAVQFDVDGSQPEELARTTTAHYCCYNLQGWLNLSLLAQKWNIDLWNYESCRGSSLKRGAIWLLTHAGKVWPYEQINAFDGERFHALWYGMPSTIPGFERPEFIGADKYALKPVFDPHDGIRPYWNLGAAI